MKIIASDKLTSRKGPADWFSGNVLVDEVVTSVGPASLTSARVTFAPGARTAWHTHPRGQALHVLSGIGWVQLEGQPAQAIRPGDSVWIEPGELHWHGATADRSLVHLAMQTADESGTAVTWLEHVTDAEYGDASAS